ncbi:hypothetical protein [Streptomyces sp. NPDC006879]|uniref:hypothetical protein n=1 Tax=Streptomyces sp. NPDC006879 TaxID=3364767 RepID=UPI0036C6015D
MKYSKVAAVVAGTVAALGSAAPAFAADPTSPSLSANGGVTEVVNALAPTSENLPTHVENAVAEQGDTVQGLLETAAGVQKFRNEAPAKVLEAAGGLSQVSPMLGGLKVNSR